LFQRYAEVVSAHTLVCSSVLADTDGKKKKQQQQQCESNRNRDEESCIPDRAPTASWE
jgi:hypothetical protein